MVTSIKVIGEKVRKRGLVSIPERMGMYTLAYGRMICSMEKAP